MQTEQLLSQQIYPQLFSRIDLFLPEFGFRKDLSGWKSTTGHKIDGTQGNTGKVYVYRDRPNVIIDYTRGSISLWNYVKERQYLTKNADVLKYLADAVGVVLQPINKKTEILLPQTDIWQDIFVKAKKLLLSNNNHVFDYLLNVRKFTDDEISFLDFGLYKPIDIKAKKELEKLGFGVNFGANHSLLLGIRNENSDLIGLAARKLGEGTDGPKYLYNTGLKKNQHLFVYIKDQLTPEVVLVEGLLDAAIGSVRTGFNFVALGGTSLSDKQTQVLVSKWKTVYLAMDNDEAGQKAVAKITLQLQDLITIKIIQLPSEYKDIDEYLRINVNIDSLIANALTTKKNKIPKEIKKQVAENITVFEELFRPMQEAHLHMHLSQRLDSLATGYKIDAENPLLLPSGAISIVAAPTGHGKTAMLINLAINAIKNKAETYFFSYEESDSDIAVKMLNTYANINDLSQNNRRSIASFYQNSTEPYKFIAAHRRDLFLEQKNDFHSHLASGLLNIQYVDYDIDRLIASIYYLKEYRNPAVIIIDYIQLLRDSGQKTQARQEELKRICLKLKDCAVNTGLPIVCAAQFNREIKGEAQLSPIAIGEAGDIERIASLIIGVWNRKFSSWNRDEEIKISKEVNSEFYLKILKNRDGRAGDTAILNFNGNTGKISDNTGIL